MEAKKCGRCGALYDNKYNKHTYSCTYYILKDDHPFADVKMDLCEHCYRELINFMNNKGDIK